jgi:hypothetical protein
MTFCTFCHVVLGRGQCAVCWHERDRPTLLEGRRKAVRREFFDEVSAPTSEISAVEGCATVTSSEISAVECPNVLDCPLELGRDAEIKEAPGKGLGAFLTRDVKKGQFMTHYDGHRVDPVTGQILMACARMEHFVSLLSDAKKDAISKLRYSKKWALNVNCLSGARVAVDGTVACSSILNDVPNRGDIGWGAFLNSSVGTGIPPTCKIKWIFRHSTFQMRNFFFASKEEKRQPVFVAVCLLFFTCQNWLHLTFVRHTT